MDQPPSLYSNDAERQILGVCLVNPDRLDEVDLHPDDFHSETHRKIYRAMKSLAAGEVVPDYAAVQEYFDRKGDTETGSELLKLVEESGIGVNLETYTRIVSDYATRRRIIQDAEKLAQIAYNLNRPYTEQLADIVDDLATGAKPRHGARHWETDLSAYYDWIGERAKNPSELWGIPTGFKDFDRMTGGIQAGELIYIAGEPGIGKSILSIQMAVQMAKAGYPGAIYSLEMGTRQVIGRIISAVTRVQSRTMKAGRMTEDDWQAVTVSIDAGLRWPLYISDDGTLTTSSVRADLAKLKAKHGVQWAVIDYDMLLNDGDGRLDEIAFTTLVSKRLKNLAKDLEIAIITVSSVTKDAIGTEGAPTMRGIRGGAQKLHNADIACVLTKHIPDKTKYEQENANLRTLTIVKGRELESLGGFNLVKFEHYPAFGDSTR